MQIIIEELKRQVIAWLLDEELFAGRDAMISGGDWPRYSISKARETAPVIQFLEQALEWGNLTYVCYPYYWANNKDKEWDELVRIEGADPNFVSFLRSGFARVVVPARAGFQLAVLHWLIYQEPFLGDPLPLPDDNLYVSIATEIRDLTRPPADGDAGDSWETRLPTTLMWLDKEAALPHNTARRLGKPPNKPSDPYCIGDADEMPTVTIDRPADGAILARAYEDEVELAASANDPENGPLAGPAVQWFDTHNAEIRAPLGAGTALSTKLSWDDVYRPDARTHHIVAVEATDSDGHVATQAIDVFVGDAGMPTVTIDRPATVRSWPGRTNEVEL